MTRWRGTGGFVHQFAEVDPRARLGDFVRVWQFASILEDAEIGDWSVVGSGCWIGRGCCIGANVHINHGSFLPHGTVIEDGVFIGPNVTMTDDKYPVAGNSQGYDAQPPVIRRGASIGAGAIILPGVVIGERAQIAAGAIITKDVGPGVLIRGEPARARPDYARAVV